MTTVVVFDLDDTLYLERDFVRSGFSAVGAWMEGVRGTSGFDATAWDLFESGVRGDTFDRALRLHGVDSSEALVKRLIQVYRSHQPEISLLADADRALQRCRDASCLIGVLTDGWIEVQQRKVETLRLIERVDTIVFSDSLGVAGWKPSEVPFRQLESAFGGAGAGFVYVADNPAKDFVAPRQLGWGTVRVRRAGGQHRHATAPPGYEAEIDVDSLDQLDLSVLDVRSTTH